MAAVPHELPLRRSELVAALLDSIEERRQRVYVLRAAGVQAAGLRDLKNELRRLRMDLAAIVSG